jgi:diguanylate cyclase (GGDEF)-like protein
MTRDDLGEDSDLLQIIDEEFPVDHDRGSPPPWQILVVDDDPQVHDTTLLALQGTRVLDRPLNLIHAHSAQEAQDILAHNPDIAVVLLDVVMEAEHAGLDLVRVIRENLGMDKVRIILRTGQPGYAPELEVIRDYDINDYRTKSELSRTRLITSLTAALRSYEQISALEHSRRGLAKMVEASAELFENRGIRSFADGVLTQIAGLIGAMPGGIVCARRGPPGLITDDAERDTLYIVGAMGPYVDKINQPLNRLGDSEIEQAIITSVEQQQSLFDRDHSVLYLNSGEHEEAVYVSSARHIRAVDQRLLEVFGTNISVGFANVYLFHQLNFLAYHDSLTGLPNRAGLLDLYDRLRHSGGPVKRTVTLLDIDHFSEINDALGMGFGNEVLLAVARRLRNDLPDSAHVGRFGGDVFGVIADAEQVSSDFLMRLFASPFDIQGYSLPVRVTAGMAGSEDGEPHDDGAKIFQRAGMALSRAKRGQRGRCERFVEDLATECRRRLDLSSALKGAIAAGQLQLHYQPKIDLDTGRVTGAEALLRWTDANGQTTPPSVFIPLAEQSGQIMEIGEWVIEQAVGQLQQWAGTPLAGLHLAINVSPEQILADKVVTPLHNALARHGIPAAQLEVEITESVVIEDFDTVTTCMRALQDLGIAIALDDFGTGFSSLSYLQRLPINTLKVDRTFIHEIGGQGQTARIAEMIVTLGKLLDLSTVAEGIETEQQQAIARQWGCRIGQGFLYAPPMPVDEFERWVAGRL